jgi:acetyltransferase-like isoleucine patch superfamily enzyme
MNKLLVLPYAILRLIRILRRRLMTVNLRLRGVTVHSNAVIDPAAIFEPSGGKISIGARTFIDRGVIIRPMGGSIEIGDDCYLNAYTVLYGGGGLIIRNNVLIAAHTVIVPSNHVYEDALMPINQQGLILKGIVIEDDVWIGAGAKILDGVFLQRGTVVGAGAVVTKTTEPYSVVVGVPAKKINSRVTEDWN